MKLIVFVILSLALLSGTLAANCNSGQKCRVLVALNTVAEEKLYSKFLDSLRKRHFNVTVTEYGSAPEITNRSGGVAFDHIVMLGTSAKDKKSNLQPSQLLNYVSDDESPINLVWAGSSAMRSDWSDFALNFGIDMDESKTGVIDHFSWVGTDKVSKQTHNTIKSSSLYPNKHIFTSLTPEKLAEAPIVFRGVAHRLTGKNALAFPLLAGNPTSYSYLLDDEMTASDPFIAGGDLLLASAVQLRNNARAIFVGSTDLFSNELFDLSDAPHGVKKTSNAEFATDLSAWAFGETGVLHTSRLRYHLVNSNIAKAHEFRVKDFIEYEIDVSEWRNGALVPFLADDLQVEAVMLDPYVRKSLKPSTSTATAQRYKAQFQLPDVHGVFTLKVEYRRYGLSYIVHSETINVRPFRHNEYDRFITNAYPYYASSLSMMAAFVLFCIVWLFNKE